MRPIRPFTSAAQMQEHVAPSAEGVGSATTPPLQARIVALSNQIDQQKIQLADAERVHELSIEAWRSHIDGRKPNPDARHLLAWWRRLYEPATFAHMAPAPEAQHQLRRDIYRGWLLSFLERTTLPTGLGLTTLASFEQTMAPGPVRSGVGCLGAALMATSVGLSLVSNERKLGPWQHVLYETAEAETAQEKSHIDAVTGHMFDSYAATPRAVVALGLGVALVDADPYTTVTAVLLFGVAMACAYLFMKQRGDASGDVPRGSNAAPIALGILGPLLALSYYARRDAESDAASTTNGEVNSAALVFPATASFLVAATSLVSFLQLRRAVNTSREIVDLDLRAHELRRAGGLLLDAQGAIPPLLKQALDSAIATKDIALEVAQGSESTQPEFA